MIKSRLMSLQLCSKEIIGPFFNRMGFAYLNPELGCPEEAEPCHPALNHSFDTYILSDYCMICSV